MTSQIVKNHSSMHNTPMLFQNIAHHPRLTVKLWFDLFQNIKNPKKKKMKNYLRTHKGKLSSKKIKDYNC